MFYKTPKSANIKNSLKCARWRKKTLKKKIKEVLQVCPQKSFKESLMGALRKSCKQASKKSLKFVLQKKCCTKLSKKSLKGAQTNKKVPNKRVQLLFHPLFCKSSPQFRHFTPSYGEFTEIWKHRGWSKGRGWERQQWTSTHQYTKKDGW